MITKSLPPGWPPVLGALWPTHQVLADKEMKPLAIIHIGSIIRSRPRAFFPLVLTLSGVTGVVYALVYQAMGPGVVALSIPPVVAVAWLLGLRAGLLAGVLFFALNAILLVLSERPDLATMLRGSGLAGNIALVLVGVATRLAE